MKSRRRRLRVEAIRRRRPERRAAKRRSRPEWRVLNRAGGVRAAGGYAWAERIADDVRVAYDELIGRLWRLHPQLEGLVKILLRGSFAYRSPDGARCTTTSWRPAAPLRWPEGAAPSDDDLRRLRYLYRPLQQVYRPTADGGLSLPPPLSPVSAEALLAAHTRCSKRLNALLEEEQVSA